jgi:hypothetical protein
MPSHRDRSYLPLHEQLDRQLFDARYTLADALETLHAMGQRAGLQHDAAWDARDRIERDVREALERLRRASYTVPR